jgi:RNA polymerase sigma-70 factor (ECF subfamily)
MSKLSLVPVARYGAFIEKETWLVEACSMNLSFSEHNKFGVITCLTMVEDEGLISAAKAGAPDAFVELYKRQSKRILTKIYRITRNCEDAEDAFQDAIMRAFTHLNSFAGRSTFRSWFTRIAINSALIILRKRRRTAEVSLKQTHDDAESPSSWNLRDPGATPELCCVRRENERLLWDAIGRLPCNLRQPTELRYVRGYSARQIAHELGISIAASKTRLMRARKSVKGHIPKTGSRTVTK